MPLTWLNGADDGIRTCGPSPCRSYAQTRIMPLSSWSERTTGFEPATLTLARWSGSLVTRVSGVLTSHFVPVAATSCH